MGALETPPRMDAFAIQTLCNRLSTLTDVEQNLPWSLRSKQEGASQDEKQAHLKGLLERDAALFLERYGGSLQIEELSHFDVLKGDYEINWHLNRLAGNLSPSPQQEKARAALVKNRRLAYLQRLEDEGTFFSEEAMRERAPLLHEQFMGVDPAVTEAGGRPPVVPRPGEGLSELIMRQAKEDHIAARLKAEREDFAKQAAAIKAEDAAATTTSGRDQEEMEEEFLDKDLDQRKLTSIGGTEETALPISSANPGRARGTAKKAGRVRFGNISGASVAGAPAVRSGTTAVLGAETAVPLAETALPPTATGEATATIDVHGERRPSNVLGDTARSLESAGAIAGEAQMLGDQRGAGSLGTSSEGFPSVSTTAGDRHREVSEAASRVNGNGLSGRSVNGEGANGRSENGSGLNGRSENGNGVNGRSANASGVNGRTGNGDGETGEKVSHARFGEFTVPDPVSTATIASQVVRTVLESAGAGPRTPITRFGEVSDRRSWGADRRFGVPDGRFGEALERGNQGSRMQHGQEVKSGTSVEELSVDVRKRSGQEASGSRTVVESNVGAGIGNGGRAIADETVEEMDTNEEDLGSRTYTDTSELGDDSVDVDSRRGAQIEDFRRLMRERFLEGKDEEHVDYRTIDSDAKLDDDWLGQVDRDVQEKYFDED